MSAPPAYGPLVAEAGPADRLAAYLVAYAERWGTYPEQLTEYTPDPEDVAA